MTPSSVKAVATGTTDEVVSDLAREMRRQWSRGERPGAAEFFARRPQLREQPEAAVELIYEEYCLRQRAGEQSVEPDILQRFPQWAGPLRVMLDCHRRLLNEAGGRATFPEVGERVGGFRLAAELFRSPRARVFVAEEVALANRPVVLKVTALEGAEHVSLARLQHTNIVPLYSVADDPARGIRALCMPYFGKATLACLLERLREVSVSERTGGHVADAIDRAQGDGAPDAPARSASRDLYERLSYVQAICWVGACLADALHFAHDRGLVHLDLKPANVLLSNDGQPMLLDFHLARQPVGVDGPPPEGIGGTPPYMPPEQQAAMRSLRAGAKLDLPIDARADIYALGAMLYEALGGHLPLGDQSPPLERLNPRVTPGLSDIVADSVSPRPEDRYPSAADLAEDLRRHLRDQPLAGVPNRSLAERWNKWRRRRPGALRATLAAACVAAGTVVVVTGASSDVRERGRQVELALADGERQVAARHFAEAVRSFERGVGLAEGLPFAADTRLRLHDRFDTARRLHLAQELHRVAEEVRALYGVKSLPTSVSRLIEAQCDAVWRQRNLLLGAALPVREDVANDLRDVAIFASALQAGRSREAAVRTLDEAEAALGPSAVLELERRAHLVAAGLPARPSAVVPARTAWEHAALGRAHLASDDLSRAMEELNAALRVDPGGCWTNFYYGLCADRLGRHEDAAAAFSVCVGAAPDVAPFYASRAAAYAAIHRDEQARRDCDAALRLDPRQPQALQLRDDLLGRVDRTSR